MDLTRFALIGVLSLGLAGSVCAQEEQAPQEQQATSKPAGEAMTIAELKAIYPEKIIDLPKTDSQGFRQNKITTVMTTYSSEDRSRQVMITIADYAANPDQRGNMSNLNEEIEFETETGYTRSTKVKGHPAMESYDSASKAGSWMLAVGDRFVVTVFATAVTQEEFKKVAEELPFDKLK
jgi:hypothetical protein